MRSRGSRRSREHESLWRSQFGGPPADDDAKRLKELERENQRLKRIVADQALNVNARRRSRRETCEPESEASGGRDVA